MSWRELVVGLLFALFCVHCQSCVELQRIAEALEARPSQSDAGMP